MLTCSTLGLRIAPCVGAPQRTSFRPGWERVDIANSITKTIKDGTAPRAAKMACARGMLPLTNEELLDSLVTLTIDEDQEVRTAAAQTVETLDPQSFIASAGDPNLSVDLLGFMCVWSRAPRELLEALIFNRSTPDLALAQLASRTNDPAILEAISLKQQSLIRAPQIIEAILLNPLRTPEAERRAREVREEFFDKQFGAQMIAGEQRARDQSEAEVRAKEEAEGATVLISGIEDLLRLGLIEEGIDDSLVSEYEAEFGPFDVSPSSYEDRLDIQKLVEDAAAEGIEGIDVAPDRLPVFQQVAMMSIKDRVMLAIKGTREARVILVRDPNRVVACAVLRNPRITDLEIEQISALKTVPEEVLRQIGHSRIWARSYGVIHNLARNPRTPISVSLGFINRIQTRDLKGLSTNKNIPDVIRTTAGRAWTKRQV